MRGKKTIKRNRDKTASMLISLSNKIVLSGLSINSYIIGMNKKNVMSADLNVACALNFKLQSFVLWK